MSEPITRDDLMVETDLDQFEVVTDSDLDSIVRSLGYVRVTDDGGELVDGVEHRWDCRAGQLRVCDRRHGWQTEDSDCRWVYVIPADMLEADDG